MTQKYPWPIGGLVKANLIRVKEKLKFTDTGVALLFLSMLKSKGIIFIVSAGILALLFLQAFWLYKSFYQEQELLEANMRQATLEALSLVEQKEDLEILIHTMDSAGKRLLNSGITQVQSSINVFIKGGAQKVVMRKHSGASQVTHAYSFSNSDNGTHTGSSFNQVIIETESDRINEKVKAYEKLIRKMVLRSKSEAIDIRKRIELKRLQQLINARLMLRGIFLKPDLAIVNEKDSVLDQTSGFRKSGSYTLPLFGKDIVDQHYSLRILGNVGVFYFLKKGGFVIGVSLLITMLLVITFVLLYQRMLDEQKLNQYKNDFINNLTHELKTPLATIALANVNMAAKANLVKDAGILNYTRIISEEGARLNEHIEKVLELSQMEDKNSLFKRDRINIHDIIDRVVATYRPALDARNGALTLIRNAKYPVIKADTFHLTNVIGNLLDNAIKYCADMPRIEIETMEKEGYLYIRIKDNGIGIDKENQERIFDKFYRVTESNLHPVKGFGLGLSYVLQAVKLMQGQITVSSERNKGSVFTLKFLNGNC